MGPQCQFQYTLSKQTGPLDNANGLVCLNSPPAIWWAGQPCWDGGPQTPPSRKRPLRPLTLAHHIPGELFKQTGPFALLLRDLFVWTVHIETDIWDSLCVQTTNHNEVDQ